MPQETVLPPTNEVKPSKEDILRSIFSAEDPRSTAFNRFFTEDITEEEYNALVKVCDSCLKDGKPDVRELEGLRASGVIPEDIFSTIASALGVSEESGAVEAAEEEDFEVIVKRLSIGAKAAPSLQAPEQEKQMSALAKSLGSAVAFLKEKKDFQPVISPGTEAGIFALRDALAEALSEDKNTGLDGALDVIEKHLLNLKGAWGEERERIILERTMREYEEYVAKREEDLFPTQEKHEIEVAKLFYQKKRELEDLLTRVRNETSPYAARKQLATLRMFAGFVQKLEEQHIFGGPGAEEPPEFDRDYLAGLAYLELAQSRQRAIDRETGAIESKREAVAAARQRTEGAPKKLQKFAELSIANREREIDHLKRRIDAHTRKAQWYERRAQSLFSGGDKKFLEEFLKNIE